jgi:hypothetical protein
MHHLGANPEHVLAQHAAHILTGQPCRRVGQGPLEQRRAEAGGETVQLEGGRAARALRVSLAPHVEEGPRRPGGVEVGGPRGVDRP